MRKFIAVLFILSLNTVFAAESPTQGSNQSYSVVDGPTTPKEYIVPRIASTSAPLRKREPKTCREYLAICERSCKERGTMFRFQCIGQDFQPFQDHYRCQCAEDSSSSLQSLRVK
ncbi:MAG: hypothetical protein AB7U29_15270 [Desulfobulbus sp.]